MRAKIKNRIKEQGARNGGRAVFFPRSSKGFTLVEMIIVIVITGILGGMVAMFLRAPIQQYMDVARRAELTDIADTAFQRLLRDIRTAVPNSVRVPVAGNSTYLEFIPAKNGGRYRANDAGGALCTAAGNTNGDALSFEAGDTCFEIIGPSMTFTANDQIVVGSTQSDGSMSYDNTITGVLRAYAGTTGVPQSAVVIASVNPEFPQSAELDSQRFQVVDGVQQAVTYACIAAGGGACSTVGGDGTCQLVRYWGYGFSAQQQATLPITTVPGNVTQVQSAVLADKISSCNFVYDVVNQRNALVAITLGITKGGETASLYEEVHVNNAP